MYRLGRGRTACLGEDLDLDAGKLFEVGGQLVDDRIAVIGLGADGARHLVAEHRDGEPGFTRLRALVPGDRFKLNLPDRIERGLGATGIVGEPAFAGEGEDSLDAGVLRDDAFSLGDKAVFLFDRQVPAPANIYDGLLGFGSRRRTRCRGCC